MVYPISHEEDIMANQEKGKESQGRKYEQATHDGTGSAASVGPGGTGDLDKLSRESGEPHAGAGGRMESQARGPTTPGGRTDDLLSGGADTQARSFGVAPTGPDGELQTGTGGASMSHSEGNRQSGDKAQQGGQAGSVQGAGEHEGGKESPPAGARGSSKGDRGA
jgi:hypothetical protein